MNFKVAFISLELTYLDKLIKLLGKAADI